MRELDLRKFTQGPKARQSFGRSWLTAYFTDEETEALRDTTTHASDLPLGPMLYPCYHRTFHQIWKGKKEMQS